jgi:hypothetical protein
MTRLKYESLSQAQLTKAAVEADSEDNGSDSDDDDDDDDDDVEVVEVTKGKQRRDHGRGRYVADFLTDSNESEEEVEDEEPLAESRRSGLRPRRSQRGASGGSGRHHDDFDVTLGDAAAGKRKRKQPERYEPEQSAAPNGRYRGGDDGWGVRGRGGNRDRGDRGDRRGRDRHHRHDRSSKRKRLSLGGEGNSTTEDEGEDADDRYASRRGWHSPPSPLYNLAQRQHVLSYWVACTHQYHTLHSLALNVALFAHVCALASSDRLVYLVLPHHLSTLLNHRQCLS